MEYTIRLLERKKQQWTDNISNYDEEREYQARAHAQKRADELAKAISILKEAESNL